MTKDASDQKAWSGKGGGKEKEKKIAKAVENVASEAEKKVTAANVGFTRANNPNGLIQRSLVLMKPDAVQRGIVGEILSRFERVGLKIVATKMVNPDKEHYYKHYEGISKMVSRRGQATFDRTLSFMTQGPVIAFVFEGVEAVPLIRKIVGSTEPMAAQMGTIRGDYAHMTFGYADAHETGVPNLIHASGNAEEAEQEVAHWFRPEEIQVYKALNERFTR
ncbi:nucleoside-diphosphate kinase [Candidatus Saccharibacteria bacterium]|nr:nucleoside-diphosphate kinase [Candidatus Saccharibacteria bacterium]